MNPIITIALTNFIIKRYRLTKIHYVAGFVILIGGGIVLSGGIRNTTFENSIIYNKIEFIFCIVASVLYSM